MLSVDSGAGQHASAFAGVIGLTAGQGVPRVGEMHDCFEAGEVSIMSICLNKGGIRPLIHVAQRRHLKARSVARREFDPMRIYRGRLAQRMAVGEKTANTAIDE